MVDEIRRITVLQTLHGYSDGHRLLFGSIPLASQDARKMLVLSDLSGPSPKLDAQGYLTGYPLETSGKYVLARTWPAPEMPRPGCVWTHSLVVDFADLASIQSVRKLQLLFKRPGGRMSGREYAEKLTIIAPEEQEPFVELDAWTRSVINALYSKPANKVIAVDRSSSHEDAILAIWMQQWPRLRRSFRFCSNVGADRSTKSDPFDLQVLQPNTRVNQSRFPGAIDADEVAPNPDLRPLFEDLSRPGGTGLRNFLRQVGGDVEGGRSAMEPLCRLFVAIKKDSSSALKDAVAILDKLGASQARKARTLLVRKAIPLLDKADESVIDFVVKNVMSEGIGANKVEIQQLGQALWARSPLQFGKALSSDRPIGGIARSSLPLLTNQDLLAGISEEPDLALVLAPLAPSLARDPSFWQLAANQTTEILVGLDPGPDEALRVIKALIEARQGQASKLATLKFGPRQVIRAISLVSKDTCEQQLTPWCFAVARSTDEIAAALASHDVPNRAGLVALARVLDPDDVPNDYGEDPWFTATRCAIGGLSEEAFDFLTSFLMSRALGYRSRSSAGLIRLSFDRVHAAMVRSRLAWPVERLVTRHFGWGGFTDWDRCARLRDAVASKFVEYSLDPETFGRLSDDDALFEKIADLAAKTRRGRRYLVQVRNSVQDAAESSIRARADYIARLIS